MYLDAAAARQAIDALAERLNAPTPRVAEAVVATVDASMARALRRVSVERGIDPRGCVLVAFGGGGPLHACGLAERVGIPRVLVPPFAGVLSALGLAIAPERREAMTSVMRVAGSLRQAELQATLAALADRVAGPADWRRVWWLRVRYAGQGHELDVPAAPGDEPAAVSASFAQLHAMRFGFTLDRPVEVVSARCALAGPAHPLRLSRADQAVTDWDPARPVDGGGPLSATVRGPATVVLRDATLLVQAGWVARALDLGGWLLEAEAS